MGVGGYPVGAKLHGRGVWAWTLKSAPPGPWAPLYFLVLVKKFQTHTIVSGVGEWFPQGRLFGKREASSGMVPVWFPPRPALRAETGGEKLWQKRRKADQAAVTEGVEELCPPAACGPDNSDTVALAKAVRSPACAAEMRGL